ncbi:NADH:flavin oxidoreductase [Allomesorhizobium camelthorni]|uniref:NADH:flavin oxidoreductase n=1 Tax=Allomesorhizobium camelthorni TaxID=475069 RepID=A0A6G4W9J9_9HYPH|nr:NADH:flavin oxidoreductase [Mesorhizobium camelthorni]NGO50830.1 NADH:flavin oxidoreductase [Mesorhizobium camelthorni]
MTDLTRLRTATPRAADPLLAPLRIKKVTFRNRIISTSHASTLDEGGMPGERYQAYHEAKALGGLALTMFGGSSMVTSDSSWGGGQIDVSRDAVIPYLQAFSARIHARGAALMCQISHLGRRADAMSTNWLPAIAPSRIRETRHRAFPREMDRDDIKRVVRAYGEAALRCLEGGLDGIETMTGGHLIGQFLSPLTNQRTDGFGGSLANRARFGLMVHEEIRRRVGDDFLVGIRFVVDEDSEDGIGFEDGLRLARLFEAEGSIDFFNCIFGRMDTELALAEQNMPGMSEPIAPFLKPVAEFKRETRLPVFHAGRIPDIATARYAIAENMLDMVGMTRAHIADPQIVNKLARGEEERIRPCVGANYCLYKKVNCLHNPASGRELHLPQVIAPADVPGRRVVVVGGGPAGLEAARVAAERGHRVTLFEVGSRPGGQLLIASRTSLRRDLIGIVDWRWSELQRLGVDLRLDTYADAASVLAEAPDAVVVATGGLPDVEWLDGGEHCTTVWDALSRTGPAVGDDVIIYDGTGRHEAASCALHLAEAGRAVSFATIDDTVAVEMSYADRVIYRKRFAQNGIAVLCDRSLARVRREANRLIATFRHELTGLESELSASEIVVERGTAPFMEVFDELRDRAANRGVTDIDLLLAGRPQMAERPMDGAFELHRIGDAAASRNVHAAIYDALRLCVTL